MNKHIFYMVWADNGNSPVKKHEAEYLAKEEAERLARRHPGVTFVVLKSIAECCERTIVWQNHYDGEVPF